jgi:hypothetical protein
MTADRDIERVLEHWLVDGVDRMPDRVYRSLLDRVERQPQHRAWRAPWRDTHVNAYLRPMAAVAAVIVLALAGIAIVGTSSVPGTGGTASPSPTPTPVVSPSSATASPPWDSPRAGPCGERGCGGPQTAGTYTSKSLKPAVTYTLTTDWINLRDWAEFFQLYPDTPTNRALAAAGQYPSHILILPNTTVSASAACASDSPSDSTDVDAAGFIEFMSTRKNLATTGPAPVTIGGLTGQQIDASIKPGWTGCLPGAPLGESLTEQDRVRYIVLDTPNDGALMIRLRTPTDFASFAAAAMPVVESMTFDLGPEASPSAVASPS